MGNRNYKKITTQSALILSVLLLHICVSGAAPKPKEKEVPAKAVSTSNVIARVDGDVITLEDLQDRINSFSDQDAVLLQSRENRVKLLDQMVNAKLLVNAAKKEGINKTEAYKKEVDTAEKTILVAMILKSKVEGKITVSDAEVKAYYTNNPQQFDAFEQRNASHILVKTEAEAQAIIKSLKAGADFATLAQEKTLDPSGKTTGGNLGWFSKGQMVPEFEKAAFEMSKGDISGPVKTQFGYHVIKLNDINVRPKLDFTPQVAQQIHDSLIMTKKQAALEAYVDSLKKQAKIEKNISKI